MHSIPNNAWMKVAMVPWAMGGVFFRNRKSRMRGGNLCGEQKSIPVCDIAGRAERLTLFFVLISWLRPIGLASQKIFVKQITEKKSKKKKRKPTTTTTTTTKSTELLAWRLRDWRTGERNLTRGWWLWSNVWVLQSWVMLSTTIIGIQNC